MNNEEIVLKTLEGLKVFDRWIEVYAQFADSILKNQNKYIECATGFRVRKPIRVYSSIGKVKSDANIVIYDLRFGGQSIGSIHVDVKDPENPKLFVSKKQACYAYKHFAFNNSKSLNGVAWRGPDASLFRKAYSEKESTNHVGVHSEEHRLESRLLDEFSKNTRKKSKLLCNIQPIRLGNRFFQLTTPIKASTHNAECIERGYGGGGIDILARAIHQSDNKAHIAVIELKDENITKEPQKEVMLQALTYATFIGKLLRSESGEKWYRIFGFKDKLPKELHIDVVTLMPVGETQESDLAPIQIDDNVTFHPYTLYFEKDNNGNPTSFS